MGSVLALDVPNRTSFHALMHILNAHRNKGGESIYSVSTADGYVEPEPTVGEYIKTITPTGKEIGRYFYGLFPFTHWITRYNVQWLTGDLIAGMQISLALFLKVTLI